MAQKKQEKRKAKRKVKQKQIRNVRASFAAREKFDYLMDEAVWYYDDVQYEKALPLLEKALRIFPGNHHALMLLAGIGQELNKEKLELRALNGLHKQGQLPDYNAMLRFCGLLASAGQYRKSIQVTGEALDLLKTMKVPRKRQLKKYLTDTKSWCESQILYKEQVEKSADFVKKDKTTSPQHENQVSEPLQQKGETEKPVKEERHEKETPPIKDILVTTSLNAESFQKALLVTDDFQAPEAYELTLAAYQIRFREAFENLISLTGLHGVRSFWYQEETAKKILKTFRGRALLADEVGLGKTIEALIVFKEYVHRGMVKSALILVPTPLVSQWRDELKEKFNLSIPSTDDPGYASRSDAFWDEPFMLASINIAKSKKNFSRVVSREYDMIIVDEAHHLKNRNTLNWKLINALKKRFLLLLTATPVENNLMELYNLITLLKPGQLKTAAAFKKEFMTRGDPTDPQNRQELKKLLGQVMIRNTRAVAKLEIPPRTAQTIRVEPSQSEIGLYRRITSLAQEINRCEGRGSKLLVRNLLAEAGSSPRAVSATLTKMLEKRNFHSDHENEIRAINTMCKTMEDTGKNNMVLKLVKMSPGKVIIFVKFTATLEHLSDFLEWNRVPHAMFHGSMTNQQKDEQIEMFRNDTPVLLSTEAGGEGRNLQFCHHMINYDLPWNPMKIEQRIGRLHRIGQKKEVMIYNLCTAGSIEDSILDILDRKINMFELVIGEIDMILGRVRGEKDFSETVFDIWVNAVSEDDRQKGFDKLASSLKRQKTSYQKTKALDEKLFGENYEI